MTGLGLAIAMFMDGAKQAQAQAQTESPETEPHTPSAPQTELPQAEAEPSPTLEEKATEAATSDVPSEAPALESKGDGAVEDDISSGAETVTEAKPIDYKSLYLAEKEKNELVEALENMEDHSYYGDGSKWSKRLYFMKEAYRRSRQATPVHLSAFLAAAAQEPLVTSASDYESDGHGHSYDYDYDRKVFKGAKKRLKLKRKVKA